MCASSRKIAVRKTIGVSAVGPVRDFEIVGIAQYGGVDSIGSATFAVFDVPTAQRLTPETRQVLLVLLEALLREVAADGPTAAREGGDEQDHA